MSIAFTVSTGGHAQASFLRTGSISIALNTLTFALVDPVNFPSLGDAVVTTNPVWGAGGGIVSQFTQESFVDRATSHQLITVTATANIAVTATGLTKNGYSDNPNFSTTFPYSHLVHGAFQNSDGSVMIQGSFQLESAAYTSLPCNPGDGIVLYSTNLQFPSITGAPETCQSVTIGFYDNGTPFYTIQYGNQPLLSGQGVGLGLGTAFPATPQTGHRFSRSDF